MTKAIKAEIWAVCLSGVFRRVLIVPKVEVSTNLSQSRRKGKQPRDTSQSLQPSVHVLNVKVQYSTDRKPLNTYSFFGKITRRKSLFFKENVAAQLMSENLHLAKPQHFWTSVLWNDEAKVEISTIMHNTTLVKTKQHISINSSYQLSSTVMEGMFCSGVWFIAATVPGYFPITELIINSSVYSSIQEANVPAKRKKKKNQGIAVTQLQSRPPNSNCVVGP